MQIRGNSLSRGTQPHPPAHLDIKADIITPVLGMHPPGRMYQGHSSFGGIWSNNFNCSSCCGGIATILWLPLLITLLSSAAPVTGQNPRCSGKQDKLSSKLTRQMFKSPVTWFLSSVIFEKSPFQWLSKGLRDCNYVLEISNLHIRIRTSTFSITQIALLMFTTARIVISSAHVPAVQVGAQTCLFILSQTTHLVMIGCANGMRIFYLRSLK